MSKKDEAIIWLERANDTLVAAKLNFKHDLLLASVNRTYYTMFYCVSGLLFSKNIFTKSHSGLITKFNEHFIKTNIIERKYSINFRKAFEYRQSADYDFEVSLTVVQCQKLIEDAEEFYSICKKYIDSLDS